MKLKKITILLLLTLSVFLSACSSEEANSDAADADGNNSTDSSFSSIEEQDGVQLQQLLAIGIVKLDESLVPISPEQANEQIILWKTLKSLAEADNVTNEEIASIYNQIESTLTEDQISEINLMELSFEDISEAFPDLEFTQRPGRFGDLTPEERATRQAEFESGDFQPPEGFNLPEGFTPGQGFPEGFTPGQRGQNGEERPGGGLARFGTEIIDEIILFLEERAIE